MHPLDYFKFCPHCASAEFIIETPSSKKCKNCGFEYFKSPSPGVAVFITDSQNRLLVVKRAKEPATGTWDLPGGFVEIGEKAEEGAICEVMEETGLDIAVDNYLFSIPNRYMFSGMDVRPLDLFFRAHLLGKKEVHLDLTENSALEWVEISKLNPQDFGLPSIKIAVAEFLKL